MTVEGGGRLRGYPAEHSQQQRRQQRSVVQQSALGMALPDYGGSLTPSAAVPSAANANSSTEDPSKKIRKPYTITKSRESWTEQEHDKFLEALQLFDRDWKKIEAFVGSKTVIQRIDCRKERAKKQRRGRSGIRLWEGGSATVL